MENRFKVRAFNKRTNEMVHGQEMLQAKEEDLIFLIGSGKKDLKNVKVYEGDRITFKLPNDDQVREGTIIWMEDLMSLFVVNDEFEEELHAVKILEVIGNIYCV